MAMRVETMAQEKFDNITIQVPTPDGTMFVSIMENSDGSPIGIQIHIGKAGTPLSAWTNALARMICLALDKGATVNDLIEELSSQTSDRRRETNNGEAVRSGVEGVWVALMQYKRAKFAIISQDIGETEVRGRGPKLGR